MSNVLLKVFMNLFLEMELMVLADCAGPSAATSVAYAL
jgi:hypothetical protein